MSSNSAMRKGVACHQRQQLGKQQIENVSARIKAYVK
jgi:hypothetical protein